MDADSGLGRVWRLLDEAFDQIPQEKYDEAQQKWEVYRRYPGQSMDQYLTEMKQCKVDVLTEDPEKRVSEKEWGFRLLRQSGVAGLLFQRGLLRCGPHRGGAPGDVSPGGRPGPPDRSGTTTGAVRRPPRQRSGGTPCVAGSRFPRPSADRSFPEEGPHFGSSRGTGAGPQSHSHGGAREWGRGRLGEPG